MKYLQISVMLLAAVALASCSSKDDKQKADTTQTEEKKPTVRIESVADREVPQLVTYTATVEADKVNNISSSTPNRIKEIYVDEGQRVGKGQKLVQMDEINTDTYRIQVENCRVQVNNAQANLANTQLDYNRAVELLKIGGGTRQAVDRAETQLINARNTLASARNQLSQAERTLRNASENTVLTSPIAGVVTARNYDPGDMTGALPILTISTVNPVKVVINVSESYLSQIKQGMHADVTFDTYADRKFSGRVTKIMPTVDTQSRTFGLEITLDNRDGSILPGMFARVEMNLGSQRHVVVPDKAVVKQPGSGDHYVYLYKDGRVQYVRVELGQRLDDAYEIISGVPEDAQVVVSGQSKLANGVAVDVIK